jgi:hypothetical protein
LRIILKTDVTDPFEWLCNAFLKISLLLFVPYFLVTVYACKFFGYICGIIFTALSALVSFFKEHLTSSTDSTLGYYSAQNQELISNTGWLENSLRYAVVVISILVCCSYLFLPPQQKILTASYKGKTSTYNSLQAIIKAAATGDVAAQIQLGKKYQNGIGVSQDFKEAENWYLKAAKQGSTSAQNYLAALEAEWCNSVAQEQTCHLPKISNVIPKTAIQNIISSNQMQTNEVYVQGYMRKNGTYVQAYRRTKADKTQANNWSSFGNINPYTGKRGNKR